MTSITLYAVLLRKIPKKHFLQKLPKGLPPKRARDFTNTLKEGSTPQTKGLYRMSSAELSEFKTQLSDLIDQEFI